MKPQILSRIFKSIIVILVVFSNITPMHERVTGTKPVVKAQMQPQPYLEYMPYMDKGKSTVWIQNTASNIATLTVDFYKESTPLKAYSWVNFINSSGVSSLSLMDLSGLVGSVFSGVQSSDQPLISLVVNEASSTFGDGLGIYPSQSMGNSTVYYGPIFKNRDGITSVLSIMNVATEPVTITADFYSKDGTLARTITRSIQPYNSTRINLAEVSGILGGFLGNAVITGEGSNNSPAPIILAVEQVGFGNYSDGVGRNFGVTKYVLPRLFKSVDEGTGFINSKIYITNIDSASSTSINFEINDELGKQVRSYSFNLGPRETKEIDLQKEVVLATGKVFSGIVTSNSTPVIVEENAWHEEPFGSHASYNGMPTDSVIKTSMPRILKRSDRYSVISILNSGTAMANVNIKFTDKSGVLTTSRILSNIPVKGLRRINVRDLNELPTNFEGSAIVEVQSSKVSVLVDEYVPSSNPYSEPLTYQSDIYGDSTPEVLQYLNRLNFTDNGGFGINAGIFGAELVPGDGIAFAVSQSKPLAYRLEVVRDNNTPATLDLSTSSYPMGKVSISYQRQLHFVWELRNNDLYVRLHKYVKLVTDTRLRSGNVIYEAFVLENLGPSITIKRFYEYLHMDDKTAVVNSDGDSFNDTLLAINDFSTHGYPILGKVSLALYSRREFNIDQNYATISHVINVKIAQNNRFEIAKSAYINSISKNSISAEQEIKNDAKILIRDQGFLNLPFSYDSLDKSQALVDRVTSWFDHQLPNYDISHNNIYLFNGKEYTQPSGYLILNGQQHNCYKDSLGQRYCYNGHNGYDFNGGRMPVFAAASGHVEFSDYGAYGQMIVIDHENGFFTLYGHLETDSIQVYRNDLVDKGDLLGFADCTGQCKGVHLHFGVYRDSVVLSEWNLNDEKVVDPNGWQLSNVNDPWVDKGGSPSNWLWEFVRSNQITIPGGIGASFSDLSGHITVEVPAGFFTEVVTLEIMNESAVSAANLANYINRYSFMLQTIGENSVIQFPNSSLVQNINRISTGETITLTVNYTDTKLLHLDENNLGFYYWNEPYNIWEVLPSTIDTLQNVISAQTNQIGHFSLQAPILCPADPFISDDDFYGSELVEVNSTPSLRLFDISEDQDWFTFYAYSGKEYWIQTSDLSPGVDTIITLYDLDGITAIATNDNSGIGSESKLTWQAPVSGRYYVGVTQNPGSISGCNAFYQFSVRVKPDLFMPFITR